ncbi:HTH-type transcriptional regulator MalT [uncultured Tolumonas sp.]|uniref:HTH-type transcriptional regulator MalT n=1 Tax=uncultured Tolumonas sp. TaxID=263765 RepID=UPI002A0A136F|nr:HTH-type transcriptional regulator MalT [uncultured Tolumonas sp.]
MLIPSKLSRPVRLQNAITRDRLLQRLQTALDYRLVLLHGPAGYGKTTLIAQWATTLPHAGWFSLDDSDNQPERFARYLVAALQHATQGHCVKSEALSQKHQYARLSSLLGQVFAELADWTEPTYLIIDDYHLIDNEEIHEAMRFFLRNQPDNLTLVVISRTLPPLGIANLRVREQLLELDDQLLAFNHQEAQQFFLNRLPTPMDEQESATLCDEVEGWATALQLIALSAPESRSSVHQSARRLSGLNTTYLWEYLAEEVMDRIDVPTRDFLLRCSVLRSMNDALVTRLTGRQDGLAQLSDLERRGLFLQRMDMDGDTIWFRFHPLFAAFLQHCCQQELAAELSELHRRAAAGWQAMNIPSEAIHHALAANDALLLREILLQYGWSLFHHGELALLSSCLDALPYTELIQSPNLVLLQAWLAQSQHRYTQVDALLERAKQAMAEHQVRLNDALQGEFNALRAQVALNANRPEEAIHLAREALTQLPQTNFYGRIVATSVIGEVHHYLGQLSSALPMMQRTEQMARRHGTYHYALWALLQQSEILIAQGFLQAAYEVQDKALELVQAQHLEQLPLHEFLLRVRAQVLWSWYRLDEAESCARQGLQVLTGYEQKQQLQCVAMLAKVSLARGDIDNASQHLQRCEVLLHNADYHSDWINNADIPRLLYWQMTGDKQSVRNWLAQAERPEAACNHFLQGQWRNIARAHLLLEEYAQADEILTHLNAEANRLNLYSDLNRNLLLSTVLHWQRNERSEAQRALMEALTLSNRTGFVSHFVIEGEIVAQLLRQLLQLNTLSEMEQHKAQRLLKDINQHHRHKFAHFDEGFVEKLLNHPNVPELIRTSPLTQREWQVLGLIYSGYSNEQISVELDVAATTIKTHIRNLYQKLGILHRQDAVEQAQKLLKLMGYGV